MYRSEVIQSSKFRLNWSEWNTHKHRERQRVSVHCDGTCSFALFVHSSSRLLVHYNDSTISKTQATTTSNEKFHQNEIRMEKRRRRTANGLFVCDPCMTLFQFLLYEYKKWLNFCLFAIVILLLLILRTARETESEKDREGKMEK